MSQHHHVVRKLRPYLFHGFRSVHCASRVFSSASAVRSRQERDARKEVTHDYEKRVEQLSAARGGDLSKCYPRLPERFAVKRRDLASFRGTYDGLGTGQTSNEPVTVVGRCHRCRSQLNHDMVSSWTRFRIESTRPSFVLSTCKTFTVYMSCICLRQSPCSHVLCSRCRWLTHAGRVHSVRTAGSKLVFIDLDDGSGRLQSMVQLGKLDNTQLDAFKSFARSVRKGDWYSISGSPHRTARGELSVLASEMPRLLSPSLHQIPEFLDDPETKARHRHVDMLVNPSSIHPLIVRHHIEKYMHAFFDDADFIKVNTPILTAGAGGAVARPFETEATELEGQILNLRIAPELWLKRLVVGGMCKVYEIGPAFRNEGVDATHNPEFSTCEFYEAFATLEDLMERTERLLGGLQEYVRRLIDTKTGRRNSLAGMLKLDLCLAGPYKRLEFIPALEQAMGCNLPDLESSSAREELLNIFTRAISNEAIPTHPSVPRLLDGLASHFLEGQCQTPTFIINHPACLSPLSKHFVCPMTNQVVAARAELFIGGREYANMYEEENSPFEQRRKFTEQLKYREVDGEGDGKGEVDASYLEALEWGLPPTGGWGCGIDRLVMLVSGRERIADVLGFGSLRNVVGLGKRR